MTSTHVNVEIKEGIWKRRSKKKKHSEKRKIYIFYRHVIRNKKERENLATCDDVDNF